jgi:RHS repeat-associated protein
LEQPYTYTGREFDSESGLYYYRARYYDPTTGKFLQKDPIGFRGGLNVYNYVDANPAALIDPYGLAGLWREGSSPGEPGPHQSLGFGDPNGKNSNYSFGVKEGESPFGGGGAAYRDRNSGGRIFDYYDVPPEYELAIWTELFFKENQEGKYNLLTNNCRHWVDSTLDELVAKYNLKKSAPPVRTPTPSGYYAGGSTGKPTTNLGVWATSPGPTIGGR